MQLEQICEPHTMLCIAYKLGNAANQQGLSCADSKGTVLQSGFFHMGNHYVSKFPYKQSGSRA